MSAKSDIDHFALSICVKRLYSIFIIYLKNKLDRDDTRSIKSAKIKWSQREKMIHAS